MRLRRNTRFFPISVATHLPHVQAQEVSPSPARLFLPLTSLQHLNLVHVSPSLLTAQVQADHHLQLPTQSHPLTLLGQNTTVPMIYLA